MFLNDEINFRAADNEHGFRFIDNSVHPEPVAQRSPRAQFIAAYDTIKRVTGSSPDLKSLFEELLRDDGFKPAKRISSPMPRSPELIEVSIWDNWMGDKPVKGQANRYGVNIKAWTHDEVDFRDLDDVDWSGRVSLMSPDVLRSETARKLKAKKKQTYPIGPEFAAMIEDGCGMMEVEGLCGGLLATKAFGEGTHYRDRQMMVVDTDAVLAGDVTARAIIFVDEGTAIPLPGWSTTDASGKPLPDRIDHKTGRHSKCVMQIRYARDPERFHGWISGQS